MKNVLFNAILFCLLLTVTISAQQNLPFPRVSPQASVSQNLDVFIKVTVDYSRPSVNGREVWGKLVPFGLGQNNFGNLKPMPWRAGANENTTITLSHDADIQGSRIPAGKYSMYMIPSEKDWTIIFNKNADSWGSFFYDESLDQLRVKVAPVENSFEEDLQYTFENITKNGMTLCLSWEKLRIPVELKFDVNEITLNEYEKLLTNLQGFNQAAWGAAARFCLTNDFKLDRGMEMIDKAMSLLGGNNFNNKMVKAGLLEKKGEVKEASEIREEALSSGTEAEVNAYGYQQMNAGKTDEAVEIFRRNVKNHPDSWNVYDSLAEGLANKGDKKESAGFYEKALKMSPENQHQRIQNAIDALK